MRLVAREVERTALRVAHERHAGVLRKMPDTGEVDAGAVATSRQVGEDRLDGLTVEARAGHGLVAGAREADQRHAHGCAVDHPRLVAPRLETRRRGRLGADPSCSPAAGAPRTLSGVPTGRQLVERQLKTSNSTWTIATIRMTKVRHRI